MEFLAKEYMKQDGTLRGMASVWRVDPLCRWPDITTIVSRGNLEKVYVLMQAGAGSGPSATQNTLLDHEDLDPEQHLYFINAMEMPRWLYSSERRTFEK